MKPQLLHKETDEILAKAFAQPGAVQPCCSKGCNACCQEPAYAEAGEVDAMLEALTPEQIKELKDRVIRWVISARHVFTQERIDATEYRKLNLQCPMMKDGLCSAYAQRPYGCRMFFATGNPAHCNLPERTHQKFAIFPNFEKQLMQKHGLLALQRGESLVMDHIGALLYEKLCGGKLETASRMIVEA